MDVEEFIERHPQLFHLAADGSWPSIRDNGLLTTAQQVERCAPSLEVADQILRQRRSSIVLLNGPDGSAVAIRDQKPLQVHNLNLVGTDLQGWLDILNGRVFFWATQERARGLLNGKAYKNHPQHLLVVDTASLVASHLERIRLTPFNTGATIYPPPSSPPRGPATFQTIAEYRWAPSKRQNGARPVGEVAVVDGVPDIAVHVVEVTRVIAGQEITI